MTRSKLAVIAGAGPLPGEIVRACRAVGREVFVVAHEGISDDTATAEAAHAWVRLGALEATMAALRGSGAAEVVLAGPVERPSLASLGLDKRALKLLLTARGQALGDGKLLSLIIGELEAEGFRVVGIDSILTDIVAGLGTIAGKPPDASAEDDIAVGCRVARALGAHDVGQAVVVQQGMVLGVEAIEGTDALIARCAGLRRDGPGGVLVKLKKPGQDARADLPTIGPRTVENAAAAGLCGIAVEAGGTLVIDCAGVAVVADAAGLFVIGITPDET